MRRAWLARPISDQSRERGGDRLARGYHPSRAPVFRTCRPDHSEQAGAEGAGFEHAGPCGPLVFLADQEEGWVSSGRSWVTALYVRVETSWAPCGWSELRPVGWSSAEIALAKAEW